MNRIPAQKQSHTVARFDCDWQSCGEDEAPGWPGSTSIQTYMGCAIFQGIIFQHKFREPGMKIDQKFRNGL